jgi:hypothetical protein
MSRLIAVVALSLSATACSTAPILAHSAKVLVSGYCSVPAAARLAVRESVAIATAPHKVTVKCDG